jgi:protein O-GlcNAc transferase
MPMHPSVNEQGAMLERGRSHAAAGEFAAAVQCLAEVVEVDRLNADAWHLFARVLLQTGRPVDALPAARSAAELAPDVAEHRYLLGRACRATDDLDKAIFHYREAIRLDPGTASVHISLGSALRAAGRLQESAEAYWRALAIDPHLREGRLHLGNVLAQSRRQMTDAESAQEADSAVQHEIHRLCQSGEAALAKGQPLDALRAFGAAAQLSPYSAELHNRIGSVLWDLGSLEEALVHYDLAARFRPDRLDALEHAGTLAAALGLVERAGVYLDAVRQLCPSDALSARLALLLPAVEESTASIVVTRQRCERALDHLLDTELHIPDPFHTAQLSSFYLAYHGKSNRQIQSKLGRLFTQACPDLSWVAPHAREPKAPRGRIKVGFVSHFMSDHSIGKTTRGLVAELSREQFEVCVINLPPVPSDETALWIRERADHWITVDPSLEAARNQIAQLQLDVLFYQDIGMEPFGYFLAYSRLAPVQCVSFGHPDTTGIPNIDYFISNDLYELPDSAQHYSERLFLLHDLPTLAYYYRPELTPQLPGRALFGLSDAEHVYLCPQTLFKVHPEFDSLLAGILRRDSKGRILLIRSHCEQWRVKLTERFRRTIPDVAGRISFVPELPRTEFMQLLGVCDVVLDTIHFNGMNTSLEAFAAGTPVVTLPKGLQRGRHTQAMYKKMEMADCVATDEEKYVEIAVRICSDSGYRRDLKQTILERNGVLYENNAVTREFERFFTTAVRDAYA